MTGITNNFNTKHGFYSQDLQFTSTGIVRDLRAQFSINADNSLDTENTQTPVLGN